MSERSREVLVQLLDMLDQAKDIDKSIGVIVESGNFYLEGETEIIDVIDNEESIRVEGRQFTLSIDAANVVSAEYDDVDEAYTITYPDKSIYIV